MRIEQHRRQQHSRRAGADRANDRGRDAGGRHQEQHEHHENLRRHDFQLGFELWLWLELELLGLGLQLDHRRRHHNQRRRPDRYQRRRRGNLHDDVSRWIHRLWYQERRLDDIDHLLRRRRPSRILS
jgi:hypothetical protein